MFAGISLLKVKLIYYALFPSQVNEFSADKSCLNCKSFAQRRDFIQTITLFILLEFAYPDHPNHFLSDCYYGVAKGQHEVASDMPMILLFPQNLQALLIRAANYSVFKVNHLKRSDFLLDLKVQEIYSETGISRDVNPVLYFNYPRQRDCQVDFFFYLQKLLFQQTNFPIGSDRNQMLFRFKQVSDAINVDLFGPLSFEVMVKIEDLSASCSDGIPVLEVDETGQVSTFDPVALQALIGIDIPDFDKAVVGDCDKLSWIMFVDDHGTNLEGFATAS